MHGVGTYSDEDEMRNEMKMEMKKLTNEIHSHGIFRYQYNNTQAHISVKSLKLPASLSLPLALFLSNCKKSKPSKISMK